MVRKLNDRFGFEVVKKVWLLMKNCEDKSSLKMSGLKRKAELGPARPLCGNDREKVPVEAQVNSELDQIVSNFEDCKIGGPLTVDEVLGSMKKLKLCEVNAFSGKLVENSENSGRTPVFDRMNPPQTLKNLERRNGSQKLDVVNKLNQVKEVGNSTPTKRNQVFAESAAISLIQPIIPNSNCESSTDEVQIENGATDGVGFGKKVDFGKSGPPLGESGPVTDRFGCENLTQDQPKPPLMCSGKLDKYSRNSTALPEESQ